MRFAYSRVFGLIVTVGALSACKVSIEIPEGGYVRSESGAIVCGEEVAAAAVMPARHRHVYGAPDPGVAPQHADVEFHCELDISDASFDETFVAVPHAGYEFKHWKKQERALYSGAISDRVRVVTTGFAGNDILEGILATDTVYYLEPVFERVPPDNGTECAAYEGSFDRIQGIIFDGYGCTNSACHRGSEAVGGLDLSADVAYRNLFRVAASADLLDPLQRVYPGEQKLSFLYRKLAAATNGEALPAGGGSPMPIGTQPLSENHLEALRLWIRNGAPEFADVDDVAILLGCNADTEPTANKIDPPDAPAVGAGVQFVSGPWTVQPNSENEVCFATYYDLTQTPEYLPDWALTPCSDGVYADYEGSCFASNVRRLTQDPQSHHSIISAYVGAASPLDPSWGSWHCLNGPHEGEACDPTRIGEPVAQGGADCGGARYVCGTEARKSIACRGWGPDDSVYKAVGMGGAQSPVSEQRLSGGVYSVLPAKGVIIWNSHAFNLSAQPTTVEQYNDFMFAAPGERSYRSRGIFDAKDIFIARVPPYEQRTYCSTYTLPPGARLTQLSSHAHKRGILWQTWLPPQDPSCTVRNGCEPNNTPADYVSRIYNDPLYLDYDPALEYDSAIASERTLKFCVTYDNGAKFPELLKRNSTSVGTVCTGQAFCAGGSTPGLSCGSDDSICGDGGSCDACTVTGGFTTEDEMFLMLGGYHVVPASERN